MMVLHYECIVSQLLDHIKLVSWCWLKSKVKSNKF